MTHAVPQARRDADHGGDEGGARDGLARPVGEGDPLIDYTKALSAVAHQLAERAERPPHQGASLIDVGRTARPPAAIFVFMWRASGARRWGSRGMVSLIESDVIAFSVLPVSVLNIQLSLLNFIIAREWNSIV